MLAHFGMNVPKRSYKTPLLNMLLTYTTQAQWVQVDYRSQSQRRWLTLLPKRIHAEHGFWYCEAYSVTHEEVRLFRVDRMEEIIPVEPAEKELEVQKKLQTATPIDVSKQPIRIRARLTYWAMLQVERDQHIGELIRAVGNDEWEVDFACPAQEWEWARRLFYSLGTQAEVLEPACLRAEIRDIASQVAGQYQERKDEEPHDTYGAN